MGSNLPNLTELYLSKNRLQGPFPPSLGMCRKLETISLTHRKNPFRNRQLDSASDVALAPQIDSIFNSSSIRITGLVSNQLSGNLPQSFGRWLPNIEDVYMGSSNLRNSFNSFCTDESLLPPIPPKASLQRNYLTRQPSKNLGFLDSLTKCRNLILLWIGNNPLDEIEQLQRLRAKQRHYWFDSFNSWKTTESPKILCYEQYAAEFTQSLPISHNKLQGQIPVVFGELKGLEYLDLPYNNSSAMIPTSLKGLLHLEYLIYLPINYKEESQMEELHRT
ncbi:hypothetical protein Peur_072722 [Populus x canadensis]